jgi:hypothetical protein
VDEAASTKTKEDDVDTSINVDVVRYRTSSIADDGRHDFIIVRSEHSGAN